MIMNQTSGSGFDEIQKPTRLHKLMHFITRHWILFLVAFIVVAIALRWFVAADVRDSAKKRAQIESQRPQPVTAVAAFKADFDVYIKALGTVIPTNTVAVKSQVGGQLMNVHFKEGQIVKKGDLLAEIDSRPFQVQLMQAEGQLARDEELLRNAESDLRLYKLLQSQDSIAVQQVTTQESLVKQYRANIQVDKAQIANAKLQITYSRITAPISGRVGLRQVDPGNMVQTNDSNYPNGIVIITQLQPATVVFSVPQDDLPAILRRLRGNEMLPVFAYDQEGKTVLATGKLLAVDNQIDTSTGTVKLRAAFDNSDNKLFPNQFVNVKLKVDTLRDATVIPVAAVQRGSIGTFAYVVGGNKSVAVRVLKLGPTQEDYVAVSEGVAPGEMVVIVGGDKLREGSPVEIITPGVGKLPYRMGNKQADNRQKKRSARETF